MNVCVSALQFDKIALVGVIAPIIVRSAITAITKTRFRKVFSNSSNSIRNSGNSRRNSELLLHTNRNSRRNSRRNSELLLVRIVIAGGIASGIANYYCTRTVIASGIARYCVHAL